MILKTTTQYKYDVKISTLYKKKLKKISKQSIFNKAELEYVISLLRQDVVLPEKYHDHYLQPRNKLRN